MTPLQRKILEALVAEFKYLSEMFCKDPTKSQAYQAATKELQNDSQDIPR